MKERREQQIAERNEGRADERVTSTEANAVVKDAGKADRKPEQQKQAMEGKKRRNHRFMNAWKSIRESSKKNREKISRREELIVV